MEPVAGAFSGGNFPGEWHSPFCPWPLRKGLSDPLRPATWDSSPIVNILWGFANFVGGCLLLGAMAPYEPGYNAETAALGFGVLVLGLSLAWHFGRVRNARSGL